MTTNMADEEQAPEETINAPDTDAPPTEAPPETEAPPTEAPPETEAPPTEAPPETEAPPTEASPESETPPVETTAETTAEPTGAAATPTPEAEDAAKSAEEPAASPGGDEAATEAGLEGQEGGDSAPAKEADEPSGEANKHIFPNGTPPADDTVEGTRDEEQAPPVDQEPPQQTPSGEQDAPVDEGEAASVGNASPSGEVVTPGGDEMQQGDKEGGQGEDQGENLTPVIKVEPEPEEEGEIGELPPNLGVEDSKESVHPFKSDGASLRTTRSGSPPMPTTPDTFSLLSGPDSQVHPLTFGVDISEEPLRGLEEVEESLLPLEYDRDELLERYHKALHERHEMQEKNYQLQHKLADYFRKKKSDEVRQEANKNVSDQEQRYLKYMANLDELRRQEHEKRERYMLEIEDVKKRCESKQNRVEEERAKFVDFKKQIALNAVNSRSGKFIPPKDVESYLVTESRKEMEVANVRLENIKLKNKLKKKEQQLKSKEELAEGLHLIDFEQLKIENQTYNEKIEERNEELLKLRKKITSTVQVLTHLKEKLQFVQAENQIQKRKLQSVEELAAKKRDILSRTKQARDGLRIDNQKLRGQCGLLANKSLLRDYEERIDESDYLRQRIQDLTMKHAELTLNLNGIKRRIEQAKVSQVV